MFTRIAKSGLAKFWLVQPRRIAPGPRETMFSKDMFSRDIHSNDNLPGFRRPAATGKRRSPSPALTCHWFDCNGRLECRWRVESFDETSVEEPDARRISSKMAARAGHSFESRTISLRCVARASLDDAIQQQLRGSFLQLRMTCNMALG